LKSTIEKLISAALAALPPLLLGAEARAARPEVERTRDASHGDYASNVAMRHAKAAKQNPRALAEAIIAALPADPSVARVELAGPGFINFHLTAAAYHAELGAIIDQGASYGIQPPASGEKILLEFVSSNPTGPLHVGHGRHAAYGAALANLLIAAGHSVHREFYINDAGRQVDILAVCVWLRYLERLGEDAPFPSNGYKGEYLLAIAASLEAEFSTSCAKALLPFVTACRWTSRKVATRSSTPTRSSRVRAPCSARKASARSSTTLSVA